jgi:hypothetical protein
MESRWRVDLVGCDSKAWILQLKTGKNHKEEKNEQKNSSIFELFFQEKPKKV